MAAAAKAGWMPTTAPCSAWSEGRGNGFPASFAFPRVSGRAGLLAVVLAARGPGCWRETPFGLVTVSLWQAELQRPVELVVRIQTSLRQPGWMAVAVAASTRLERQ